jgi:hypothetical protein
MSGPNSELNEPDWLPPPPASDPWRRTGRRALNLLALHAVVAAAAVLGAAGAAACHALQWHRIGSALARGAGSLVWCESPALALAWVGFITYLVVRSRETPGAPSERGRMLVLALDVMTAIFVVMGAAFGLAMVVE